MPGFCRYKYEHIQYTLARQNSLFPVTLLPFSLQISDFLALNWCHMSHHMVIVTLGMVILQLRSLRQSGKSEMISTKVKYRKFIIYLEHHTDNLKRGNLCLKRAKILEKSS